MWLNITTQTSLNVVINLYNITIKMSTDSVWFDKTTDGAWCFFIYEIVIIIIYWSV